MGQIMPLQNTGAFTNHSGVVDYKGKSYFIYHTGWLPGGGGYSRSFSIEEFEYNADGSIPELTATRSGAGPITAMSPYICQQAETMNCGTGIRVEGDENTGVFVSGLDDGDSIHIKHLDFGSTGASSLKIRYAAKTSGGSIVIRLDKNTGKIIGRMGIADTGGEWQERKIDLSSEVTGIHDIVFTFVGISETADMKFDWWQFSEQTTGISAVSAQKRQPTVISNIIGNRITDTGLLAENTIYIKDGTKYIKK